MAAQAADTAPRDSVEDSDWAGLPSAALAVSALVVLRPLRDMRSGAASHPGTPPPPPADHREAPPGHALAAASSGDMQDLAQRAVRLRDRRPAAHSRRCASLPPPPPSLGPRVCVTLLPCAPPCCLQRARSGRCSACCKHSREWSSQCSGSACRAATQQTASPRRCRPSQPAAAAAASRWDLDLAAACTCGCLSSGHSWAMT